MDIPSPTTALSPSVHRLICCTGVTGNGNDDFVLQGCLLSWDDLAKILPLTQDTSDYFEQAVSALAPVFHQCELVVDRTPLPQLLADLQTHFTWTSAPQVLTECVETLKSDDCTPSHHVLILLLASAVLERSLGNVYLTQGYQCPSMLKDLLATQELADILGSTVMETLRVVIGPPISLNLRNVAWHGFFSSGELPRRYCCFLLIVTASIGKVLAQSGQSTADIPHRPCLVWTETVKLQLQVQDIELHESVHSALVPLQNDLEAVSFDPENARSFRTHCVNSTMLCAEAAFTKAALQCAYEKLMASSLTQPQMQGQWKLAFHLYEEGRYGLSLALILPLLEHILRRLFAALNGCPERVLTAESSALYTTFNEMLDQSLPDGQTNQLPAFLGTSCMDLLLDLLFYPDGPRVRDRLSHGEVDFACVDHRLVDPFVGVAVFLAERVTAANSPNSSSVHEDSDLHAVVVSWVQHYSSQFHPIAILQQKLSGFLTALQSLDSYVVVSPDLEVMGDGQHTVGPHPNALLVRTQEAVTDIWKCEKWKKFAGIPLENVLQSCKKQCETFQQTVKQRIPTLFRWQSETKVASSGVMRENEFVGLLLRVTEECTTSVEQTQQALQLRQKQLMAKELRSRQRENLKKLLFCVPCLQILLCTVAAKLVRHLELLHTFAALEPSALKLLQRHLKTVLQHCENMRTYTSPEKNKWTESVDLLIGLLPKLQQFVMQWPGS